MTSALPQTSTKAKLDKSATATVTAPDGTVIDTRKTRNVYTHAVIYHYTQQGGLDYELHTGWYLKSIHHTEAMARKSHGEGLHSRFIAGSGIDAILMVPVAYS